MEKNYKMMGDVVPPSTPRTIRRVPINRNQVEEKKPIVEEYIPSRRASTPRSRQPVNTSNGVFTKIVIILIVLISIVAIVAAISLAYAKGTLSVTPKKVDIDISTSVIASTAGSLKYRTIKISDTAVEVVNAKPGKFTQTKASGNVSITNTGTVSQVLITNTRIESTSGKIFRITKSVTIPANKSVTVAVIADEPGEAWNTSRIDSGKLTIPGFKGSKKFDQFYAELETDISGGFSGTRNIIETKVHDEAKARLTASLTELIKARVRTQVSDKETYSDNLFILAVEELPQVAKGTNQGQISLKGTGIAYVFNTDELVTTLGAGEVKKIGAENFKALTINNLTLTPKKPIKGDSIEISALGKLTLIGNIPADSLKKDLEGASLDNLNAVLKKYTGISKASAKISPFWKKTFPNNQNSIVVEILPE